MSLTTTQLLHKLSAADDINKFMAENESEFRNITWQEFLRDIISEKNIPPAEIARRSGQGEYVYKVIRGERKASRDVCIAMAFGMGLCFDETQLMLRIFKWGTLDPRDKRDSVIIYCLNEKHTVDATNDLLYDMELQTL